MAITTTNIVYLMPPTSIAVILSLMTWSDPSENVTSILLVFLMLYILFASLIFIIMRHGRAVFWHIVPSKRRQALSGHASMRRLYYIASITAFAPVCLLAMQSLGKISLFDFALVAVLTALAVFYALKRTETLTQ